MTRKVRFARVVLLALCALLGACRGEAPAPSPSTGPAELATDPSTRLRVDAFGATWTPAPGDGAMFEGTSDGLEVEGAIRPSADSTPGFGVEVTVEGEARILLPGTWREARVEAEIETNSGSEGFDGLIVVELRGVEHSRETIETRPEEPFVLALAVSGMSATSFFDGKVTVETALDSPPAEGRAGLRLRGEGTLRLRRLQVVRLASAPFDASD